MAGDAPQLKPFHFKPGQSGNPAGRAPSPYRKYTKELIAELFNELSEKTTEELKILKADDKIPALESIMAAAMVKDRELGSTMNTDKILERIIGKVPVKNEHGGKDGGPITIGWVDASLPDTILPQIPSESDSPAA